MKDRPWKLEHWKLPSPGSETPPASRLSDGQCPGLESWAPGPWIPATPAESGSPALRPRWAHCHWQADSDSASARVRAGSPAEAVRADSGRTRSPALTRRPTPAGRHGDRG